MSFHAIALFIAVVAMAYAIKIDEESN